MPYPYGPRLEWCRAGELDVRFLWLLPITRAERELKKREGLEALEQGFDAAAIDALDPRRPSVV